MPHPLATLLVTLPFAAQATGEDWCANIGRRLLSVPPAQCQKLGLQPAKEKTMGGHALMARDYPPHASRLAASSKVLSRAPRILIIGGIHGDELTSASIVFRWMQWLEQPDAQRYHWRVIPVANPDGLLANPAQRTNRNGVDLNRNFPSPDWQSDAHVYWSKRTDRDPRRFPGETASSEIETRWLNEQLQQFQPDVVVSVHAPYGILDYDGPARQPRRFGNLSLNRLGVYPGSLGNYAGIHMNIPVITIELPNATAMPPPREQREIWEDMLTWLRRNINAKRVS